MTASSSHLDAGGTFERSTRVSLNAHQQEDAIEPISTVSATQVDERSCLRRLCNWCRDICRAVKRSDDESDQKQMELDLAESDGGDPIQKYTLAQAFRPKTRDQPRFPLQSPYRTIKIIDKTSVSIACNAQHILLKQKPNLCLLDKQLTTIKEIPWTYDHVKMCWSSTLNRFILTTEKIVFTLDENTMIVDQCPIDIHNDKEWSCGACSDTSLYLSTADMSACLYEYTLQPTMEFVKEWPLAGSNAKYEAILTFNYANGKLALVISNIHSFRRRLDLRSTITLERLWSIRLDTVAHCCSFNDDQWIVMELLRPRLLHISSDGKILQEFKVRTSSMDIIWNAIQWDSDTIITFTMKNLNLHKLS